MTTDTGPLVGVRVLDLSRVLAGPWASQVLADFGAEVIKVEQPGVGDATRTWGPPWIKDAAGAPFEAAYHHCANRGKRAVAIDFSRPEGQDLIRRLAVTSDLALENYLPGTLARFGLDHEHLARVNPRLITCSITGFGQDGPLARKAAYDVMIQAMGGLMSVTGLPEGEPGAGPLKVGVAISDLMTGMYAVSALLAALHWRERTGQGQHIDLALMDTQVAWLANIAMNYLVSGAVPGRIGNANPNIVPYQAFATADGHLLLAVGTDPQFLALCRVLGRPDLAVDARFATNAARVEHRGALVPALAEVLRARSTATWVAMLEEAGIPCGPVQDLAAVFAHPQVQHRGLRLDLPHPVVGSVPSVANPVHFAATPVTYRGASPPLGWHTREVLGELGLSSEEIDRLAAAGVVGV
jgi:crotonobetainyl-CoA:carnitine CoA-transferase CaiB-like acyl-CoA transferase